MGKVAANNKNCGARVDWFGFPISPHFPPFFLGGFHQCTPPPHNRCQTKPCFLTFSAPNSPFFPLGIQDFPRLPPFPPIFPHFPPFFLGGFHQCIPPPHSLAANQHHVFWPFQPQNSPFFRRASKISHTFPHFPPVFLNQAISDKCTVTFRKRVFLRPALWRPTVVFVVFCQIVEKSPSPHALEDGGGGVGHPEVCGPKLAQIHCSFGKIFLFETRVRWCTLFIIWYSR